MSDMSSKPMIKHDMIKHRRHRRHCINTGGTASTQEALHQHRRHRIKIKQTKHAPATESEARSSN